MENIKKKFNKLVKYFNYLNNLILLKNTKKTKIIPRKKSNFVISNFNKYLITLISSLFLYLFYLTLPNIYDKTWVQTTIEKKLLSEFNINFSTSSDISYEILPSPHFIVRDVKILNKNTEDPKEISRIKELNIFISQNNFFKKDNLEVRKVLIKDANFLINKEDFTFFGNFFDTKFSTKELVIRDSNIFFKDLKDETISIIKISNLSLFYDELKLFNKILLGGEMFNNKFTYELNKDLQSNENMTLIKSKVLKLKLKNKAIKKNKIIKGFNELSILNSKLNTQYEVKKDEIFFKSIDSQLPNNKIDYKGKIKLRPFDLIFDIDLEKKNLTKFLNLDSILIELLKLDALYNDNLSATISLNINNITDNKIFNESKIIFNFKNGEIDFDNSYISSKSIGVLKLINSRLLLRENNLLFMTNVRLNLENPNNFFSFLQISKKNRKPINNIFFNLDYNSLDNKFKISDFSIDASESNKDILNILDNFNQAGSQKIDNIIEFKNLANKLLEAYAG
jgi:hypothetical protein